MRIPCSAYFTSIFGIQSQASEVHFWISLDDVCACALLREQWIMRYHPEFLLRLIKTEGVTFMPRRRTRSRISSPWRKSLVFPTGAGLGKNWQAVPASAAGSQ